MFNFVRHVERTVRHVASTCCRHVGLRATTSRHTGSVVVGAVRVSGRPAESEGADVALVVGAERDDDVVSGGRHVVRQLVATELAQQSAGRRVGAVEHTHTVSHAVARLLQLHTTKPQRDHLNIIYERRPAYQLPLLT